MKNIIVFGYGFQGVQAARFLEQDNECKLIGFADNSEYKQGNYVYGEVIRSVDELKDLQSHLDFSVVIASDGWRDIVDQCNQKGITVMGVYLNGRIAKYPFADFSSLDFSKDIRFYAGDICDPSRMNTSNIFGLSLTRHDDRHICHNVLNPYPIPDNSISAYEAEDVFEYIPEDRMLDVINEVYRVLKPGGYLRICMPDYNSPIIKKRTMTDVNGQFVFDAGGGGSYGRDGISKDGSVYFSTYENLNEVLNNSRFNVVKWLCYYTDDGVLHRSNVDESLGYVHRIMGHEDNEIYSLLVDCYK